MPYGAQLTTDLAYILGGDFSVAVSYGAQACRGIYRETQTVVQDAGQMPVELALRSVTIAADALTGLAIDQPITVDGTSYRIRDTEPANRGLATRIVLAG